MKGRFASLVATIVLGGFLAFGAGCQPKAPNPSNGQSKSVTGSDRGKGVDLKAKVRQGTSSGVLLSPENMLASSRFGSAPVENGHNWHAYWKVEKWNRYPSSKYVQMAIARGEKPDAVEYREGNVLCTAGITRMLNLLVGAGGQALDNTHCRIGTGDVTTAATAADTDLGATAGSTHRWFQVMDATYPSVATNVATFKASYGSSDGNFAWQEFGIDAGTSSGNTVTAPLLNHKISSLGTKTTGTWALTVTLTVI